jgi:hypothetical protein
MKPETILSANLKGLVICQPDFISNAKSGNYCSKTNVQGIAFVKFLGIQKSFI